MEDKKWYQKKGMKIVIAIVSVLLICLAGFAVVALNDSPVDFDNSDATTFPDNETTFRDTSNGVSASDEYDFAFPEETTVAESLTRDDDDDYDDYDDYEDEDYDGYDEDYDEEYEDEDYEDEEYDEDYDDEENAEEYDDEESEEYDEDYADEEYSDDEEEYYEDDEDYVEE